MNQVTAFKTLFARELDRLKTEIESYTSESDLWMVSGTVTNSAGNLCLHLLGNLNTYVGDGLGHSGYIRNRELEFTQKNIPRLTLLQQIEATKLAVNKGLDTLTDEDLPKDFPMIIWEQPCSVLYTLTNLLWHLGYHIGQINYHRRLQEQSQL